MQLALSMTRSLRANAGVARLVQQVAPRMANASRLPKPLATASANTAGVLQKVQVCEHRSSRDHVTK